MSITASEMIQGAITRNNNTVSSHTTPDMIEATMKELEAAQGEAVEQAPVSQTAKELVPAEVVAVEAAEKVVEAPVEDAAETPAEEVTPDDVDSARFARLARRERSLRQREAELNSKLSSQRVKGKLLQSRRRRDSQND